MYKKTNLLIFLLSSLALLFVQPALAEEPTWEEINEIAHKLNCPTCQGFSLADCPTVTCQQWRDQISDLLVEGYGEQEVLGFFATRYGEHVLQEPPKSGETLWLWLLPMLALLGGAVWLVVLMRRWQQHPEPIPLTTASDAPGDSHDYLRAVEKDLQL